VRDKVIHKLSFLALPYQLFLECMDEKTSSISEAMNSSVKSGPSKTAPSMSIDTSAEKQLTNHNQREKK